MKYRTIIKQDEDGNYTAQCPALPGCISEGKTREEVLTNIKDAIGGYLASLEKHNEPIPPSIEEETVEVSDQAVRGLWHRSSQSASEDWL